MFGGDDDKVVALGQELLLEVVCYLDFQANTEFITVINQCFLRLMQRESLVISSAFRRERKNDFLDWKIIVGIDSYDILELLFWVYCMISREPVLGDSQIPDSVNP